MSDFTYRRVSALLLLLLGLQGLVACKPTESYSARSFESGAKRADYAVSTYELAENKAFFARLFEGENYSTSWSELDAFRTSSVPSERTPYQDSWYPEKGGGTNVANIYALSRYDQAFGTNAAQWEADNHTPRSSDAPGWFGHCNGSSAAALRFENPRRSVYRPSGCSPGRSGCIEFTPFAIRALLAEINMNVRSKFIGGNRCELSREELEGKPRANYSRLDSCEDVNPGAFHVAVVNYMGRMGQPLIHDQNFDDAVWNYPLGAYSYQAQDVSLDDAARLAGLPNAEWSYNPDARAFKLVDMRLWHRKFEANFAGAGTFPPLLQRDVRYILELDDRGEIIGGEWIGASRLDHPDFIWIPFEPNEPIDDRYKSNPYVRPEEVVRLWAESVDRDPNNPFPAQGQTSRILFYPRDLELVNWGNEDYYYVHLDGRRTGAVFMEKNKEIAMTLTLRSATLLAGTNLRVILNGSEVGTASFADSKASLNIRPRQGFNVLSLRWSRLPSSVKQIDQDFRFYAM